jgi:hypothetical protein
MFLMGASAFVKKVWRRDFFDWQGARLCEEGSVRQYVTARAQDLQRSQARKDQARMFWVIWSSD